MNDDLDTTSQARLNAFLAASTATSPRPGLEDRVLRRVHRRGVVIPPLFGGALVMAVASAVAVVALAVHGSRAPLPARPSAVLPAGGQATTSPGTGTANASPPPTSSPHPTATPKPASFVTLSGALTGSLTGLRVTCPSGSGSGSGSGPDAMSFKARGSLNGTAYDVAISQGTAGTVGFLVSPSASPVGANDYWIRYGAPGTYRPGVLAQVSADSDAGSPVVLHLNARLVC